MSLYELNDLSDDEWARLITGPIENYKNIFELVQDVVARNLEKNIIDITATELNNLKFMGNNVYRCNLSKGGIELNPSLTSAA